jgi:hypothetical protein
MQGRSPTRERALRILLSALLGSGLTGKELSQIAQELTLSPSLSWTLGALLRDVLQKLDVPGTKKNVSWKDDDFDAFAYSIISERRLSKETVLHLMSTAMGEPPSDLSADSQTMRDLLRKFFAIASINERRKFLEMIEHSGEDDPYLRGIAQRR